MKNPEERAWSRLYDRAEAQLSPGFADRALRAAGEASPTLSGVCYLSVATATLCLLAGVVFYAQSARLQGEQSLAGWQEIASAADDVGPTP